MPWQTPTLKECREMVRDDVTSALSGAVLVANSVLRVISDAMAAMAHLVLRYIDWLSKQLMPDTAEKEWLDRHGDIWLQNFDESVGRKAAQIASGTVTMTGIAGTIVPKTTLMTGSHQGIGDIVQFETFEQTLLGEGGTPVPVIASQGGVSGNFDYGERLTIQTPVAGLDSECFIVTMIGGKDEETDDELRMRVLERIREPPMGGDAEDYVAWALQVPGVTRAWTAPLEMGAGTVTVRFMCDDLRATTDPSTNGFPFAADIGEVHDYLNKKRPVAVKDFFVAAPIPEPINVTIIGLTDYNPSTVEAIELSLNEMLLERGAPSRSIDGVMQPAQTIYSAWVADAILNALPKNGHFNLSFADHPMPTPGHIAVLGEITYQDPITP